MRDIQKTRAKSFFFGVEGLDDLDIDSYPTNRLEFFRFLQDNIHYVGNLTDSYRGMELKSICTLFIDHIGSGELSDD